MSQITKKVDWCINKAKKELQETGLHRGLIVVQQYKSVSCVGRLIVNQPYQYQIT